MTTTCASDSVLRKSRKRTYELLKIITDNSRALGFDAANDREGRLCSYIAFGTQGLDGNLDIGWAQCWWEICRYYRAGVRRGSCKDSNVLGLSPTMDESANKYFSVLRNLHMLFEREGVSTQVVHDFLASGFVQQVTFEQHQVDLVIRRLRSDAGRDAQSSDTSGIVVTSDP